MSVDPSYLYAGGYGGGVTRGVFRTGAYYGSPQAGSATSAGQGVGTLKAHPITLPGATTFDRIAIEITSVGEAGSLVRMGAYADDGTGYPGALLFDAGTVAGDVLSSTTAREITISQTLSGIVWVAAAVQNVVTTQPTVRTVSAGHPIVIMGQATTTQAGAVVCYTQSGVTGAFPANFTTTLAAQQSATRVLLRKA